MRRILTICLALLANVSYAQYLTNIDFEMGFGDLDPVNPRAKTVFHNRHLYTIAQVSKTGEGRNLLIKKYGIDGTADWEFKVNGTANGDDYGMDLLVDNSGNVYATGAVATTSQGHDFYVCKLNSAGALVWSYTYNYTATSDDIPFSLCLNTSNEVFVTGRTQITEGDAQVLTIKLSALGMFQWA